MSTFPGSAMMTACNRATSHPQIRHPAWNSRSLDKLNLHRPGLAHKARTVEIGLPRIRPHATASVGAFEKGDHVSPLKAHAGNPVEGKPLILQFVELVVAGNDRADLYTLRRLKDRGPKVLRPIGIPWAVGVDDGPKSWFRLVFPVKEQRMIRPVALGKMIEPAPGVGRSPKGDPIDHMVVFVEDPENLCISLRLAVKELFGQLPRVTVTAIVPGVYAHIQLRDAHFQTQGRVLFDGLPDLLRRRVVKAPMSLHPDAMNWDALLEQLLGELVNAISFSRIRRIVIVV